MTNRAEEFVHLVCHRSFLSLWSYENPIGENAKELCDALVVCEPDVIIFSVKEVTLPDTGDVSVDWERWRRRAIDDSCKQLYGAERKIKSSRHVIRSDGSAGLPFPQSPARRIHRVAVAVGGGREVPVPSGDPGKGFVHVFDETSFAIVLHELDTVSDFVTYLVQKEHWLAGSVKMVFSASEEDLLAIYLRNGRTFPEGRDFVLLDDTLWDSLKEDPAFKARKEADKESYVWDNLIERFCRDVLSDNLEFSTSPTDAERAVRTMAREDRFARRILGRCFAEFLELSAAKRVRSRKVQSPSGVVYVFLAVPRSENRRDRAAELECRCFVARGLHTDCTTVVGIATERPEPGAGSSLDLMHMQLDSWTKENQANAKAMQTHLHLFSNSQKTQTREDEWPGAPDRS